MVFLAFKGAQLRSTCSTRERPPAGCKTFARLDFRRVPLPAARITMAKSLLGFMRCGHSAGGSKNSQPAVAERVRRSFKETSVLPRQEGASIGGDGGIDAGGVVRVVSSLWLDVPASLGALGGDGPERGIGQETADQLGMQGMTRFVCFHAGE